MGIFGHLPQPQPGGPHLQGTSCRCWAAPVGCGLGNLLWFPNTRAETTNLGREWKRFAVTLRPLRLLDFRSLRASCRGEVPRSARLLAAPRCSSHRVAARGRLRGGSGGSGARARARAGREGRQAGRGTPASGGAPCGRGRRGPAGPPPGRDDTAGQRRGKPGDSAAPLPARPTPHSPIRASAAAPTEESGCPRGAAARTCSSGGSSSSARTELSAPIMPGPSQAAVPLPARRRRPSLHASRSPFASPAPESGSCRGFNTQDSDRRRPPAPEPAPPRPDPLRPAEAALPARLPLLRSPPGGAAVRAGLGGCPEEERGGGRFCPLGAS